MKKLLTVSILAVALNFTISYSIDSEDPRVSYIRKNGGGFLAANGPGLVITEHGAVYSWGYSADFDNGEPRGLLAENSPDFPSFGIFWIGAIVEDSAGSGALDTLVSTGDDCLIDGVHEFHLTDDLGSIKSRKRHIADIDISVEYTDDIDDNAAVRTDPYDSRGHIPIGINIAHESVGWHTSGYDNFIIANYYVKNMHKRDLKDVRVGLLSELSDSLTKDESRRADDSRNLSGYFEYEGHACIWMAGADVELNYDININRDKNQVMGIVILDSSAKSPDASFNWWVSSEKPEYDWGPQYQINYDNQGSFDEGRKGSPAGDIAKYRLMSNGEIDYDQAFSNLNWGDKGWIENSSENAAKVAEGLPAHTLLSLGPFDLAAGEAETLTVAYVVGRSFHDSRDNYAHYLKGHTDDSLMVAEYYNNLNFENLYSAIDTVLKYNDLGWENIPIGPPSGFDVDSWDYDYIQLSWNKIDRKSLTGYNIYRGTRPGVYSEQPITPEALMDTTFIDYDVADNTVYYYAIACENRNGMNGGYSNEISINTGQPHTPQGLSASGGNGSAELSWKPNSDNDLFGYAIYRKSSLDNDYEIVDTVAYSSFADFSLYNGVKYFYKIQAVDLYGNSSFYSDSIRVIPMAFDSGAMLISANYDSPDINPDHESMIGFYENLLAEYPHAVVHECPGSLPQLSPFSTIIWCKEMPQGRVDFATEQYLDLFADYLDAGGNLVLAGPRLIAPSVNSGILRFDDGDFRHDYLNIAGAYYPGQDNGEFIGGEPADPEFPEFALNSAKGEVLMTPGEGSRMGLSGVGILQPRDTLETIYRFTSMTPDTSIMEGKPVALFHNGPGYNTAVLGFPLFYVDAVRAYDMIYKLLNKFGEEKIVEEIPEAIPESIELLQNFPNPFNFRTEIRYILPEDSHVTLEIFDILGRSIITLIDEFQGEGVNSVVWDGKNANGLFSTSGIYFYRLTAGNEVTIKRMVYLK